MDVAVVVILVSLWAAILLPGLVRARRYGSPASSVSRFNGSMDLLERTSVGKTKTTRVAPANGRPAVPSPEAPATWASNPTPHDRHGRRRLSGAARPGTVTARRRVVLLALAGLFAAALVSVPFLGSAGWVLAGVVAALLAGYVATLRRIAVRRQLARRVGNLESARVLRRPGSAGPHPDQPAAAVGAGEQSLAAGVVRGRTPLRSPQR